MRREVRYEPLPSQLKFHLLDARFKGFSGPVGSGKTAALDQEALRLAYVNSGRLGLIGAPTYRMLEDVTQKTFMEFLEANEIPHLWRASSRSVLLRECGSQVVFRSLDKPTALVGTNLAWFALDELTYTKPDSWRRMVARLRDPKARELRGTAVWTPRGFDWVYDLFIKPGHAAEYAAIQAKAFENKHVGGKGYYESLGNTYDERFFQQEALGLYLNVHAGQVYYAFDRVGNVDSKIEFDPRRPLLWSLDFNRNPACSIIAQAFDATTEYQRRMGESVEHLHIIEELGLPDTPTEGVVREFWRRIRDEPRYAGKVSAIEVFGDATGNQERAESNRSNWKQVQDGLTAGRGGIKVSYYVDESNPPISDRVGAVNALLRNQKGERRLLIHPRCQGLIKDFEQVTWKEDATGMSMRELSNNGDKTLTHRSDALGYLIWKRFKRTKPVWSSRRII